MSQAGEPSEMTLDYFRRELNDLNDFLAVEYCARYIHLSPVEVSLGTQLWSEGVRIPSGP